jgi:hypothetical protein
MQTRKVSPRAPGIDGIATPFIIREQSGRSSDHLLRSGQVVSFMASARSSTGPLVLKGRLEIIGSTGAPTVDSTPLVDGDTVRVRELQDRGYFSLDSGAESARGSLLVIVKADVPDQTRATTCDERLRDGDFAFVHTLSPSVWVGVGIAGNREVVPILAIPSSDPRDNIADPECARDEETCRSDRGGPICVRAPACAYWSARAPR